MSPDATDKSRPGKAPNLVLRRIREQERQETRGEFAESMARVAREMGEHVFPDTNYVAKLEAGDIRYPGPLYRRILSELCGRPFGELGFSPPLGLSVTKDRDSGEGSDSPVTPKRMNIPLRNAVLDSGLELEQIARKVGVDPKSVQRWITRGVVPHPRHRWKACEILALDESELWPDAADITTDVPERRQAGSLSEIASMPESDAQFAVPAVLEDEMKRRQFLLGAALSPAAYALESIRGNLNIAFGHDDLDHLGDWEEVVAEYGYAYLAVPPMKLIPDLAVDLATVHSIAARISSQNKQYSGWCRVGGVLSGLMAKSLSNLGDPRSSRQWWNTAQHLTGASGDLNLCLWVRGQRVIHGLYENRPVQVLLRQAKAAREYAHGQACPGRADVSTGLAQVSVLSGDYQSAEEELHRTEIILSRLPSSATQDTGSIMGWGEAQLRYTEAWVYSHMGDAAKTDRSVERALQLYPEPDRRSPAQIKLMQALARINSGDISEGIKYAKAVYQPLTDGQCTTMVNGLAQQVFNCVPADARNRPDVVAYGELVAALSQRTIEA